MALFGFAATLGLILTSYAFSGADAFYAPFGLGPGFMFTYYFLSLTFFVIFTVSAATRAITLHRGKPDKGFLISLLGFSIGSFLGSSCFLVFMKAVSELG